MGSTGGTVASRHPVQSPPIHQLAVADGAAPAGRQQQIRGWDDDAWVAAAAQAGSRPVGFRAAIEATTDDRASGPVDALGPDGVEELCRGLRPLVDAVVDDGTFAYPNPIGVPAV